MATGSQSDPEARVAELQKRPKIFQPKHTIAPMSNRVAIFSFMLCCSMRENLMLNVLAAYAVWALSADLPPHLALRSIFTSHENTGIAVPLQKPVYKNSSLATTGLVKIVQSLRNIVGSVFDLSHVLLCANIFTFNSKLQLLYSICNLRQFSLLLLEGMENMTEAGHLPSPQLLELYRRVAAFEQFVQGPDFALLCAFLPRPLLPATMPAATIPSLPRCCPRDVFASLALLGPMEIVLHNYDCKIDVLVDYFIMDNVVCADNRDHNKSSKNI
jgi:hypothetical protein